jgi:predicted house-cleaning NTP pyrophosphatase (Maf/HAM1 superfamily)
VQSTLTNAGAIGRVASRQGKAGGYAIQGLGAVFVARLEGSFPA